MKKVKLGNKFIHTCLHTKSWRIRKKCMSRLNKWFKSLPVSDLVLYTDFKW